VQIGVTVMGALSSAIGGAASVTTLEPLIAGIPIPVHRERRGAISIGIVVIVISYLTLIIGELVAQIHSIKKS